MSNWKFETQQVHAGHTLDSDTGARAIPIYQSTSFVFPTAKSAADRFALAELGPIYTRLGNPTNEAVENRIATLHGGVGALLTASGQSAETVAILTLGGAGNSIISSPSLYGGTTNLLARTLAKFGIDTRFVTDPYNPHEWKDLTDETTIAYYGETIPNPQGDILDIEAIAGAAHEVGVPLIVDNTVASPYITRPFEFGADIVVESATKYLGGHGTTVAGVIVDSGNFDFATQPERFPDFNEPDRSYNGLVYAKDLGADGIFGVNLSFILKARTQIQRDLGFALAPHSAFLIVQGIETLSLRLERHLENTLKVAQFLHDHPKVTTVRYSSLPDSPFYPYAQKYTPKGAGAVLSFDLDGGRETGEKFVDSLELFSNLANIGDVRSLIIHPASTTHSQLNNEELAKAGITAGTLRLSVGIEHIDDILADLEKGFEAL